MKVVQAGFEIMDSLNGEKILRKIERVARVCYKSEDKITTGSAEKMVRGLVKRGHEAMLEHFSFSVKFTVDRGVSHELVRHRIASFAQESTRYCNYGHEKEITVVEPYYFKDCQEDEPWKYDSWADACRTAEADYLVLIEDGASPQEARAVLPNSLKTEIVVTANLREWRNIFKLRAVGVTGKPHPQMLEVMVPLLEEVKKQIPVVFDDLVTK